MLQQELLKHVVIVLEQSGIEYMVTGSVVSSIQGEPRLTHDIDIVVAINRDAVGQLIEAFPPPRYYLDKDAAGEAIDRGSMFNMIDSLQGDKVDFWLLTEGEFDASRFRRKCIVPVFGLKMYVSSPEDTIIAKLRWAKMSGGSEKQFQDALRIYEIQHGKLDKAYIDGWVSRFGLETLWQRMIDEATPM
jgi:hypothetical protein